MVDIIGRAAELNALHATIDRTPGAPPGLVLHGDPGVGKSVLLQAGVERARRRGMRVLASTGCESEEQLAFGALHQLLAPVIDRLPRIEPFSQDVLRRTLGLQDGPVPGRLAVSVAWLALLAAVAEDGPVLVAVEDTHRIDRPSREVLMFLLLRLEPWDVRAVFTRRSLTGDEHVPAGLALHEVRPLARTAAETLLRRLHPRLPQRTRRRVLRDAAGNPLALAELPEVLGTDDSADGDTGIPPGTRLERGHAGRVLSLPGALRRALLLAAVDGDGVQPDPRTDRDAASRTALSADDVCTIEALGLVTRDSTPSAVRFRHPLVRSAVVHSAVPAELRAAHRALAERHRADPGRRIRHLVAAADGPSEETAAEIERAARTLTLRGATGLAVDALHHAAALSPDPTSAAHRLRCAAESAADAGRPELAQDLLDEAQQHGDETDHTGHGPTTKARIILLRDGDLAGARRLLAEATAVATAAATADGAEPRAVTGPAPDTTPDSGNAVLERTFRTRVTAASYTQDPAEWQALRRAAPAPGPADADADAAGTHVRLLHDVLCDVARTGHGAGPRLRAAFALLPRDAHPGRIAELCGAAAVLDALHDYRDHVHDLIRRETGRGAVTYAAVGHWLAAQDRTLSGDWSAAEAAARTGLELSLRHGLDLLAQNLRCSLGLLAAGRGDVDGARAHSGAVERWAAARGSGRHLTLAARNLALAALSEGDYETAYAQGTRITPAGTLAPHVTCAPWTVLDLVDAAVHTGRAEEARAHVAAAEHAGLADLTPRLRLHLLAARALTTPAEEAVPLFRAALALPRGEYWPFDHARVRLALGELHRRRQHPADARTELHRAADIFARTGATAWRDRAEQELRAAGARAVRGQAPAGGKARKDPAGRGLTAQQLEVAHLAASGLSNKEIGERLYLSPRTVGAHLYRIFPKLGITSRSALRDALGKADGREAEWQSARGREAEMQSGD